MLKKLLLLIFLSVNGFCATANIDMLEFTGGVDVITKDKLNLKYSPLENILNVRTDENGQLSKRLGIVKDNTTAMSGSQKIRNGYTYRQSDGDEYLIWQSSNSIFYRVGDGTYGIITSTYNTTYNADYATANDLLYVSDGNTNMFSWDGTTRTDYDLTNSTNMVKARYIEWAFLRMWYAGIDGQRSRVYYSEVLEPANIQAANFIDIAPDDGDVGTGLLLSGDSLIFTKKYSTWEITQIDAGRFNYSQISPTIGCLYNSTLINYKESPAFLSKRGVEHYQGNFNLLSAPIDNTIKSLNALSIEQQQILQSTAQDWGAGTGTNIDTTTYSGSMSIQSNNNKIELLFTTISENMVLAIPDVDKDVPARLRFKIISTSTFDTNRIDIKLAHYTYSQSLDVTKVNISLCDKNMNVLTYGISDSIPYSTGIYGLQSLPYMSVNFANSVTLNTGSTYYIRIATDTFTSYYAPNPRAWGCFGEWYYKPTSGILERDTYNNNWVEDSYIYGASTVTTSPVYKLYNTSATASFTSKISTATSWGTWGQFVVNDSQPAGSTIDYYIKTSTANDNFASKTQSSISNGQTISSTVGEYVQVIASFTRTDSIVIPKLNDFTIKYYGTTNDEPQFIEYDDCLYVSVSTDNASTTNDTTFIYQKDNSWTKYNWNAGGFTVSKNKLYQGSSLDLGQVYQCEVDNIYTDDGVSYNSTWATPFIRTNTVFKNVFNDLWVVAEDNSGDLTCSFRIDGSEGSWNDLTAQSMDYTNSQAYIDYRLPILSARAIQFMIQSTSKFNINRMHLFYNPEISIE